MYCITVCTVYYIWHSKEEVNTVSRASVLAKDNILSYSVLYVLYSLLLYCSTAVYCVLNCTVPFCKTNMNQKV